MPGGVDLNLIGLRPAPEPNFKVFILILIYVYLIILGEADHFQAA
jgi:hypothetical protein